MHYTDKNVVPDNTFNLKILSRLTLYGYYVKGRNQLGIRTPRLPIQMILHDTTL